MEEKATQMTDPVFDKVNEISSKDNKIAEKTVDKFVEIIKKSLDEDEEFTTKHGFLALGKTLVYLAQTLCKDIEHFNSEVESANSLFIDKMLPGVMPLMKDGKIVEEDFDLENVSLRRLLMSLGCGVDYLFWRNEISQYSTRRNEVESENQESESA